MQEILVAFLLFAISFTITGFTMCFIFAFLMNYRQETPAPETKGIRLHADEMFDDAEWVRK